MGCGCVGGLDQLFVQSKSHHNAKQGPTFQPLDLAADIRSQRSINSPSLFYPSSKPTVAVLSFQGYPFHHFIIIFPLYPNDTKAFTLAHSLLEEIGFRQTVYPGRSLILRSFRRTTNPTYTHTHYTLAAFPGRLLFLFFFFFFFFLICAAFEESGDMFSL